jgi:hypothetical protein
MGEGREGRKEDGGWEGNKEEGREERLISLPLFQSWSSSQQ